MKKIILLLIIVSYGDYSFAQSQIPADTIVKNRSNAVKKKSVCSKNQQMSPPFFSEDFSAGIPAGWINVDNSGNGVLWRTTSTGAVNSLTPVDEQLNSAGTSASNGYLILDSDSAGPGISQNTDLTSSPINCSGHSSVHLSFNEYFAQYGSSAAIVSVSNDNINWTDVHHAETGLVQDSGTANPYALDIDISAVAANQPTVYIRLNYVGNYDYWWFVDDLQLYEPTIVDLAAFTIQNLNAEYTRIPYLQATTLTLNGEIKNVGVNATNGGSALLELVDVGSALAVFSENVSLSALSPGNVQVVSPTVAFAPPSAGLYKARITVTLAGDGNAANDIIESAPFIISDSTYQRDDDVIAGVQGIGFGPGENGIAGQSFMVNQGTDITSITFFLKDTFSFGASGTPLFFTIHSQLNNTTAPDGSNVLGVTDTLLLFDGMIPAGGAFYTLHLQGSSLHLDPGYYFIGFHELDGLIPMGYSNNIFTSNAIWAYANSMGWFKPEDFGFYISYMIRANFGMLPDFVDASDARNEILVFPNPSTGNFKLLLPFNEEKISAVLFDVRGRNIFSKNYEKITSTLLDFTGYPAGIYYLHLKLKGIVHVKKICISE